MRSSIFWEIWKVFSRVFFSLSFSNQFKGKKATNGIASKQKAEPKNQSKKNGVNGTNGTASLKRNNSSE